MNNTEEQDCEIIENFLKKHKAQSINGFIRDQIDKKGGWDKMMYINRCGIHIISIEDLFKEMGFDTYKKNL